MGFAMKNKSVTIKNGKRRGEWAELCFMEQAMQQGLEVSKPWGESSAYDVVVEHGRHFWAVQVKSTTFAAGEGWSCCVRDSKGPYEDDAFDFLAAYIVQLKIWYIIPADKMRGRGSVALYPGLKSAKYEPYREAWELLKKKPEDDMVVGTIHAAADWRYEGRDADG